MEQKITILNGIGVKKVANGTYDVTSNTTGYINETINPAKVTIEEGRKVYNFTVSAAGNLTLHVTEDGTTGGTPVVGAEFYRCDAEGNTYGNAVTSNDQGNAIFYNMPYAADNAPTIYYKQTSSDGEHVFDVSLKSTTLKTGTEVIEVENADDLTRTFNLTDDNYQNLPIINGELTLKESA